LTLGIQPRCQIALKTTDLEAAHGFVRAVLAENGYEDLRARRSKDGFETTGVHGKSGSALLWQFIPFGRLLGVASRTRVRVKCIRSLNERDDQLHIFIRVVPIREIDDEEEVWAVTQDDEELLGDSLQARRRLRRLIAAFEDRDFTPRPGDGMVIEDDPAGPHRSRGDLRERIRQGARRRNRRLILGICSIVSVLAVLLFLRMYVIPEIALATGGDDARAKAVEALTSLPDWAQNEIYYIEILDRVHERVFKRTDGKSRKFRKHSYLEVIFTAMAAEATEDGRIDIARHLRILDKERRKRGA
jgi:hypothetical protein